jgi:alcohol dehydrogenase class IV
MSSPADQPGPVASFDLATPGQIWFGAGRADQVPDAVARLGRRALVVTGSRPERHAGLTAALSGRGVAVVPVRCAGEPTVADAEAAVALARAERCDVVLGLGGGSVLDLAKAAGALTAGRDVRDHLEVVGRGLPLPGPGLPVVAVPTTAGTGSEVTRNAVLGSPEHGIKASVRGPTLLARLAVVDPLLTLGCPPGVTASSGLDAFTQCLEPFVSLLANPVCDGFARTGLQAAGRSLRTAFTSGEDVAARTDMALCSLLGGLALANAKLGAVHGMAGVIGGRVDAPHGAVCAALLPAVVTVNLAAVESRAPGSVAAQRYAEAGGLVTGEPGAGALLDWIRETGRVLGVPGLASYGLTADDVDEVVAGTARASSTKGNPVALTDEELAAAFLSAL